jgi:deoxyxylulose-5-phosphate synthase
MEEIEVWEDNTSIGGLYEAVQELKETPSVRILSRGIPDRFIPHGGVETLWKSISS